LVISVQSRSTPCRAPISASSVRMPLCQSNTVPPVSKASALTPGCVSCASFVLRAMQPVSSGSGRAYSQDQPRPTTIPSRWTTVRAGIDSRRLSAPLNFARSMAFALRHREAFGWDTLCGCRAYRCQFLLIALSFVVWPSRSRPVGGRATLNVWISMPYFEHGELHHHSRR
jgi:hypothetical protein